MIILPLTERQRNLLRLLNQMSQNTTALLNRDVNVDLPSFNFGLDLGEITIPGEGAVEPPGPPTDPSTPEPTTPTTLEELLVSLVNEQVEIAVPFGTVTGVLLAVRDDYVVVRETEELVLIRIEKIEYVREI